MHTLGSISLRVNPTGFRSGPLALPRCSKFQSNHGGAAILVFDDGHEPVREPRLVAPVVELDGSDDGAEIGAGRIEDVVVALALIAHRVALGPDSSRRV